MQRTIVKWLWGVISAAIGALRASKDGLIGGVSPVVKAAYASLTLTTAVMVSVGFGAGWYFGYQDGAEVPKTVERSLADTTSRLKNAIADNGVISARMIAAESTVGRLTEDLTKASAKPPTAPPPAAKRPAPRQPVKPAAKPASWW